MTTFTNKQQALLKNVIVAAAAGAAFIVSGASHAADGNATATGTVIAPIAITGAANLVFGSFAAGPGGSITVSTSGVRSATGVVPMGASTTTAARFDITGTPALTYSITHAGTAVLTNTTGAGAETMTLTKFSDLTAGNAVAGNVNTGTLSGAGAQSLFVGGTLSVAAGQVAGIYTGTVLATVEYN